MHLSPSDFSDYTLLDSGNKQKLERFGEVVCIRPEPLAIWKPQWAFKVWENKAHARFVQRGKTSGDWQFLKDCPKEWQISYLIDENQNKKISFNLNFTKFKHVGLFPEQAANWRYIYDGLTAMSVEKPKFLNLFAYTGAASLAARAAGAEVRHVDSIKQVVSWSRKNMESSGLDDIRWVVEDALTFAQRELKRGNKYHGIIMDPPAFGRGPNGQKWKLEDMLDQLLSTTLGLLDEQQHMFILNTYSLGLSSLALRNMMIHHKKDIDENSLQFGELYSHSESNQYLPMGIYARFSKGI